MYDRVLSNLIAYTILLLLVANHHLYQNPLATIVGKVIIGFYAVILAIGIAAVAFQFIAAAIFAPGRWNCPEVRSAVRGALAKTKLGMGMLTLTLIPLLVAAAGETVLAGTIFVLLAILFGSVAAGAIWTANTTYTEADDAQAE